MTFGEKLKELRTGAGYSQSELAEHASIPVGTLKNYEQGIREPYWDTLLRLAAALRVPAEAFTDCTNAADIKAKSHRPSSKAKKPRKAK